MREIIIFIAFGQIVIFSLIGVIALPVYAFTDLTLTVETMNKYASLFPLSTVMFVYGLIAIDD